ncbi:MAG: transposase [Hyphomicrobiaceae bacterium]
MVETEHRGHAVIELHIRDLKAGPLAHFPSGDINANSAWTQLAAISHNLARFTQIIGLPGASPRMLDTFQRRLLRISGRLVRTGRRLILRLPARWPWQRAFIEALTRIRTLPAFT